MKQVAIVGVGLIGGSIGACLRENRLCQRVVGVGRNLERLRLAQRAGLIDAAETDLPTAVADSEFAVVCTPVETIAELSITALESADDCVVTDAGSTKQTIVDQICQCLSAQPEKLLRYVGSHPVAGSEQSGFEAARPDLFKDRLVIMTPTQQTAETSTAAAKQFWELLGARTVRQSPVDHDRAMASISHLPHLIASALAASTPQEHLPFAAVGWGDTTRIASGEVELWRQIVRQNAQPLIDALRGFEATVADIRSAIETGDDQTLVRILQQGKTNRDSLGN